MDTKSKFIALFITLIVSSISCARNDDVLNLLENLKIKDVKISVDERIENSYCKSWRMTDLEIKQYFALASVISSEERRLAYDWGGCNLEGNIKGDNTTSANFSINAGGTASVLIDGKEIIYGCKATCNILFDFGFYTDSEDED